jgi:hypothetical protein
MQKMPKRNRERLEGRAAWFTDQVKQARTDSLERGETTVEVRLAQFRGDVFRLYECLWYAETAGVRVTFIPSRMRQELGLSEVK